MEVTYLKQKEIIRELTQVWNNRNLETIGKLEIQDLTEGHKTYERNTKYK